MVEWEDIPAEIKEMILHRSTKATRSALRACSSADKMIVDQTKLNTIHLLLIGFVHSKRKRLFISIFDRTLKKTADEYFECLETFQKGVTRVLKSVHCVESMVIFYLGCDKPFKLTTCDVRKTIRVESLNIYTENKQQTANLLSQIEPIYLRKLKLTSDSGDETLYDMPQVVFAERIKIFSPNVIREDQLLKLNARYLSIHPQNCSLQKYVKRCCSEASTKLPRFIFRGFKAYLEVKRVFMEKRKRIMLNTNHPQIKFELELKIQYDRHRVEGGLRFDSEKTASIFSSLIQTKLRIVELASFIYLEHAKCWIFKVKRLNHPNIIRKVTSIEQLQTLIDKTMENTDFIKHLYVRDSLGQLEWKPRTKPLAVRKLVLSGNLTTEGVRSLLQQIDHVHLDYFQVGPRNFTNGKFVVSDVPPQYNATLYIPPGR